MRLTTASRSLVLSVLAAGLGLASNPAFAATKTFTNQQLLVEANGMNPAELFVFDLVTEDSPTTKSVSAYTNPGTVTPTDPDPMATRTDSNPLLTSPAYTFTGYKVLDILNGKRYENGVHNGDMQYRKPGGTNAEDVGVFNYSYNGLYPTDLIAHAAPDDLWNPGGVGMGFASGSPLPVEALDNYVSFGGFAFDVFENGVFDEPYQLFTVSSQPASGTFTELMPGDYAGCPGSCVGAKVNVPGPLPLLGVGAAFGFSRRLRRRI